MSEVEIVRGRDLAENDLKEINRHRKLEFNSPKEIRPRPDNDDWDKPYFLVRDDGKLVAFGRLHNIDIEYEHSMHHILGIATIVAIAKGNRYGSQLITEMKVYIGRSGLTAIGFCNTSTAEFYKKCGYSILKDGLRHFIFLDAAGNTVPSRYASGDVLYVDGEDHLMSQVNKFPDKLLTAYRPEW